MSFEELENEVKTVLAKGKLSPRLVQSVVDLAMANMTTDTQLATLLFKVTKKATAPNKLSALYLLDAVAREARSLAKKQGKGKSTAKPAEPPVQGVETPGTPATFLLKLENLLSKLVLDVWENGPLEHRDKVRKVLDIWLKAGTFNATALSRISTKLAGESAPAPAVSTGAPEPVPEKSDTMTPANLLALLQLQAAAAATAAAAPAVVPPPIQLDSSALALLQSLATQQSQPATSSPSGYQRDQGTSREQGAWNGSNSMGGNDFRGTRPDERSGNGSGGRPDDRGNGGMSGGGGGGGGGGWNASSQGQSRPQGNNDWNNRPPPQQKQQSGPGQEQGQSWGQPNSNSPRPGEFNRPGSFDQSRGAPMAGGGPGGDFQRGAGESSRGGMNAYQSHDRGGGDFNRGPPPPSGGGMGYGGSSAPPRRERSPSLYDNAAEPPQKRPYNPPPPPPANFRPPPQAAAAPYNLGKIHPSRMTLQTVRPDLDEFGREKRDDAEPDSPTGGYTRPRSPVAAPAPEPAPVPASAPPSRPPAQFQPSRPPAQFPPSQPQPVPALAAQEPNWDVSMFDGTKAASWSALAQWMRVKFGYSPTNDQYVAFLMQCMQSGMAGNAASAASFNGGAGQ